MNFKFPKKISLGSSNKVSIWSREEEVVAKRGSVWVCSVHTTRMTRFVRKYLHITIVFHLQHLLKYPGDLVYFPANKHTWVWGWKRNTGSSHICGRFEVSLVKWDLKLRHKQNKQTNRKPIDVNFINISSQEVQYFHFLLRQTSVV